MNKILTIIQREYLSRVKKKSFLVTTFLLPIGMFVLMLGMIYMSTKSGDEKTIKVIDESALFRNKLEDKKDVYVFEYLDKNSMRDLQHLMKKDNVLLCIYATNPGQVDSIVTYSENSLGLNLRESLSQRLNTIYQNLALQEMGINRTVLDSLNETNLPVVSKTFQNEETHSEVSMLLGFVMGIIIYMVILLYGVGVMRGVMEEKTNRIAEVIISSVSPFQLMLGKIIGIALVGLTQFALWFILMMTLNMFIPLLIPGLAENAIPSMGTLNPEAMKQLQNVHNRTEISELYSTMMNQNWTLIIFSFLFYFLGGYFLYASLFAAVGSLVNEDAQDAQQFTLPVTLPIIFAFFIMMNTVNEPNSNLAVFGSIFPLTSPIVMLARIPYGVPVWQILTSMICLIIVFIFFTWISSKIYRTGILMYGKKASLKEIIRWIKSS